jgi:hypothetical protein
MLVIDNNSSDNFLREKKKAIHSIKVKVLKDYRAMDSVKTIIQSLLTSMGDLAHPQKKFLLTLFSTLLMSCPKGYRFAYGKANFSNLSRYSRINERTYRRQYQRSFNFIQFNQKLIEQAIEPDSSVILAVDCSFIPKSGKQTYGIDYFYNGSASRAEKGLEVSAMAVVDVSKKCGYSLSVQQTPPNTSSLEKDNQPETTRINHYLAQLEATVPYLPTSLRYVVSDGFYSKIKWIEGVTNLKLEAIGKLRRDANLRYPNCEEYSGRGRPRKYGKKVDLTNYSNFELVTQLSSGINLYTAVVWSISLKRQIRIVYLRNGSASSTSYAVLFCTHLELDAYSIYLYYKSRFQIEFLFRDSKQFTGLADCQARDLSKLDFHFNASLTALNLAKWDTVRQHNSEADLVFSMASYKRRALNYHLLERFIDKLDLEPTLIKSHPNYSNLYDYGAIAA